MIPISVYRRYVPPVWAYRQASSYPAGRRQAAQAPPRRTDPEERREAPPPAAGAGRDPRPEPPRAPASRGILPAGLDSGDLFLAAMLFFLYSESHDEDFLIILIVVGLSIFQK